MDPDEHMWALLHADDLKLTNILTLFIWCVVGTPFSWHNTKGGMSQ